MKQEVLTEIERKRIKEYLQNKKSSQAIRVLRHRAKKYGPVIEEDLSLLKKLLEVSRKTK